MVVIDCLGAAVAEAILVIRDSCGFIVGSFWLGNRNWNTQIGFVGKEHLLDRPTMMEPLLCRGDMVCLFPDIDL